MHCFISLNCMNGTRVTLSLDGKHSYTITKSEINAHQNKLQNNFKWFDRTKFNWTRFVALCQPPPPNTTTTTTIASPCATRSKDIPENVNPHVTLTMRTKHSGFDDAALYYVWENHSVPKWTQKRVHCGCIYFSVACAQQMSPCSHQCLQKWMFYIFVGKCQGKC